jgi:hypothetical protein
MEQCPLCKNMTAEVSPNGELLICYRRGCGYECSTNKIDDGILYNGYKLPDIESRLKIEPKTSIEADESIIKQMEGVIVSVDNDRVEVRLSLENINVFFPRILFNDEALLEYGTPIFYQIKARTSGHRYQCFSKREDKGVNPYKEDIEESNENGKPLCPNCKSVLK